jgi:hypothetical protein
VSRFRSSHTLAATSDANFGIKGTLALYDSSAPFEPEVRNRFCSTLCANFGFGALALFALFLLAFLALIGFAYLVGEAMAGSAVVMAAAAPVSA